MGSQIREINPVFKLVGLAGFVLALGLIDRRTILIFMLAAGWGLAFSAGGGSKRFWGGWLWLASISVPLAVSIALTTPGEPLFYLPQNWGRLALTSGGLTKGTNLIIRVFAAYGPAYWLAATTPLPALLAGLRQLRVPALLLAVIELGWRYLAVMQSEAVRMIQAQEARGWERPKGFSSAYLKAYGPLVGALWLRAWDRSDRIYQAMLARGYSFRQNPPPRPGPRVATADVAGLILWGMFLFLMLWWQWRW